MHIPERTCIGCLNKKYKPDLLRFVYQPSAQRIAFDPKKRIPGRGFYLCANEQCLKSAIKRKGLDRAYRTQVPKQLYQTLSEIFYRILKNEG